MRHGHVHNPGEILYGRLPGFSLSAQGVAQAQAARDWLAERDLDAIYCSPMQRARQTAGIVAERHPALSIVIDERINEVHTPYDGQPLAQLEEMGWDLYSGNEAPYEVPGGILARVLDFFGHVQAAHPAAEVLAVAHGDILVFPWLQALGHAPEVALKERLQALGLPVDYPATASIMSFTFGETQGSAPAVRYFCPY